MKRFATALLALAVCAALLPLGGCRVGSLMSGLQPASLRDDHVNKLSPEDEHYLGRAVSARILQTYKPLEASNANTYVNRLCQALVLFSPDGASYGGYYAQLLDTREAVSFAAPGGFIFISRGMLAHVSGESELAALLAHEIAHVQNRDGLKGIYRPQIDAAFTKTQNALVRGQANAPAGEMAKIFGACVDDIMARLTQRGYSGGQESQANEDAAAILRQAGYDPAALDSLLARLDTASGVSHPDGRGGKASPVEETPARAKRFKAALGQYAAASR